jgi:hypothetical protein
LQGALDRPWAGRDTYAAAGIGRADTPRMASAGIGEGDRAAELALTIQIVVLGSCGVAGARDHVVARLSEYRCCLAGLRHFWHGSRIRWG